MIECYNITFHTFITMISRIMLQKNTLLFAALSAALWGSATQAADAAVVASLKPLGFIAPPLLMALRIRKYYFRMGHPSMIIHCVHQT
ncbi:high-affinity zinc transporter periplasmic protein [Salmonella enterica subsp. enterica]|uniref:High-affinity zinc transporter periplasmic protein n=1 Tax=Salmonella enterica I TaxID=59201 RepID=A0A447PL98_SALET|nr:high-affinity zinc transporter periplasmic protein [Salmonella enterica subsp. enterica]